MSPEASTVAKVDKVDKVGLTWVYVRAFMLQNKSVPGFEYPQNHFGFILPTEKDSKK